MINVVKYWITRAYHVYSTLNTQNVSVFFVNVAIFKNEWSDSVELPGFISLLFLILFFASMMQFANWILKSNSYVSD
jgi:hypothetical protein